jgi:hypothetical protein
MHEEVERRIDKFAQPTLSFANGPTAIDDPSPTDYSQNESFFHHKQHLELVLEAVETIAIYGDIELRRIRKAVVDVIQAHLEILDGLPAKQWLLLKERKFPKTSLQGANADIKESKFCMNLLSRNDRRTHSNTTRTPRIFATLAPNSTPG